jgi:hypothetical protein
MQLRKWIGRRVEVPSREVEIHRRVRQVSVAQQELNRPQVGARFQEMRRVGVSQRVRRHAFVDPRLARGPVHRLPDHLRRDRGIGTPAVVRPRKEIGLRSHPPVVLTECGEERGTEGDLAVAAALALLDAEHHALAIDVADFELARFVAAQAGPVERQQQRAVIEIPCPGDQPLDFVGTEDDWQAESLLGIRQVLAHIASLQNIAAEEPECADLGDDGPHGEPSLFEQIQVIAPELRGRDPIEARSGVLAKRINDLDVTADGRGGVIATYQFVAQTLQ